jgi:hypothetical protein
VRPEVFDRVKFRGIRRQFDQFEPRMGTGYGADGDAAVPGPTVPDKDDLAADVPEQVSLCWLKYSSGAERK